MQKQEIKNIFQKYLICLSSVKMLNNVKTKSKNKNYLKNYYQNYIDYIYQILDTLNPDESSFLRKIYLQKISKENLGYSISGYYAKRKSSIKHFFDLFDKNFINVNNWSIPSK